MSAISSSRLDAAGGADHVTFAIAARWCVAPRLTLFASIARAMSPKESPSAISFDGSGCTWYCLTYPPIASTPATPGHAFELRPDDPVLDGSQIGGALEFAGQALPVRSEISAVALANPAVPPSPRLRSGGRYSTVHM